MIDTIKNPLILVDGSFYLYRAYYAFPFLTNSIGEPTGAVYGMLNMLRSLILQYQQITHMAIIFDANGKTFRNELFEQYKTNRPSMPDNLRIQIEPLFAIIKAMGLKLISVPKVEADDVIGTLAHKAEKIGYSVLIFTGDKDMTQLITPKITLINTITNTILSPDDIKNKYGIVPKLITDFLALTGDHSDNIPGVPGIGKKTARLLLQKFGGLNKLYAEIKKITNLNFHGAKKIATSLEQNREIAFLSYKLAKIKTNIKLGLTYKQLAVKQPDNKELLKLFKKYEFKRWEKDIKNGTWPS